MSTGTNSYTCQCPIGLGGLQCNGVLNSCACVNGGTCLTSIVNGQSVNQCSCPAGYGFLVL